MKKRPQILIIDDADALVLDLARDALSRIYDLCTASGSLASVDFLRATPLDLLSVAVGVPVLSGIELIRIIRACSPFLDIPIIALPASLETRVPLDALQGEAVLHKPFSIDALVRTVADTLERSKGIPGYPQRSVQNAGRLADSMQHAGRR